MPDLAREFTARAEQHLRDEYLPRIEAALGSLAAADLWWRPHAKSNSVGNLLLHLAGNVRQWILHGLGEQPDQRLRDREFSATDGVEAQQLLADLRRTVLAACELIGALDESSLLRMRRIQGRDCTGLAAVFHVVEHFSWHCGQIVLIAKERGGESHGLAFYDDRALHDAAKGISKPDNPATERGNA